MNDRFIFYSQSADKLPGKGKNEFVADPDKYTELSKISNWRQILGNFYICDFEYEGSHYRTIEHALQAKKFQYVDLDLAYKFTTESGSDIGMGDGLLARKQRKTIILSPEVLARWDREKWEHIENMFRAKFSQCETAKTVLLATGQAELWHFLARVARDKNLQHWISLENIRDELRGR